MANKIYAFVGPHASGKKMLIGQLISLGIHYIPTYTTRPPRRNDVDTIFYRYMGKDDFFKLDLIVKITYKGHYFGILKEDVLTSLKEHPISMILLEANGIKQISKLIKTNIDSIYIMVDYVTLVERMLRMGEKNTDIKYHLEYAENNNEFDNWKLTTFVVKNIREPRVATNQILAIFGLTTIVPPEQYRG